jgi:DNA-binding CsgD family transcriptional regulator
MKEKILELRKNGYSYNQIVEELKCAKSTVSYYCKNIDNSKYKGKSTEDIELINKTFLNFLSVKRTAKELKMDRNTIIKYLSKENFEIFNKKINDKTTKTKSDYVVDWRKRTKVKLVEYKGGCCIKCGYNKSMNVLQFHHLDPSKKDFTIGGKSWSYERLKEEVDKCILVCANCHIEIHEEQNILANTSPT